VLDHISEFFSHASMEGTQALHIERQLREVARVRYEALKNQTRAELIQTLDAMMEGSEVVIKIRISLCMSLCCGPVLPLFYNLIFFFVLVCAYTLK